MRLRKRYNNFAISKSFFVIFLNCMLCVVFVGYAALGRNVQVDGSANLPATTWKVQFNNIRVSEGSVDSPLPTINNETTINFDGIKLNLPNDYYQFFVDVENNGTLAAKITSIIPPAESENLEFTATYDDGTPISVDDVIGSREMKTLLVTLKYKENPVPEDITQNVELTINFGQAV